MAQPMPKIIGQIQQYDSNNALEGGRHVDRMQQAPVVVRGRIPLAPRQTEILARVALGWTNKHIARDLRISPATVKTTLERLFRVSGAQNRTALVEWWRRRA